MAMKFQKFVAWPKKECARAARPPVSEDKQELHANDGEAQRSQEHGVTDVCGSLVPGFAPSTLTTTMKEP